MFACRAVQTCARRGAPRAARAGRASSSAVQARAPRALAGAAAGLGLGWAAVQRSAPVRCEAAIAEEVATDVAAADAAVQAAAVAARNRAWRDALREALAHWASFLSLCVATFLSTAVERVALASQVQQLVALPGQVGLEDALRHVAAIFGIKAVHLLAEAVKGLVAGRLGAALERRGRARWLEARKGAPEAAEGADDAQLAVAAKLLVVDAAPRVVVEGTFGVVGAAAALRASPFQAVYFVAHEALLGQVVGAVAAALAGARDARQADDDAARTAWAAAAVTSNPSDDKYLRDTAVALSDAQLALERAVDAGQLAVLASYVVTSACIVERRVLGADAEKYQQVMGFAGGAMQAAQEIGSCAEALGRGTDLMVKLHALEDAGAVDALAASPYFGGALGKR